MQPIPCLSFAQDNAFFHWPMAVYKQRYGDPEGNGLNHTRMTHQGASYRVTIMMVTRHDDVDSDVTSRCHFVLV